MEKDRDGEKQGSAKDLGEGEIGAMIPSESERALETQFLKGIFALAPLGVYIVQDGKIRFANSEFQKMTGFSENELLGMESLRIAHPGEREIVGAKAMEMLKGERSAPYTYQAVRKDGVSRWFSETAIPVRYEGREAALVYATVEAEKEQAKEALRLSEEKFYRAFLSSPDWVVITALEDGFYVDVNESFLRMTGYRRDEVIGRTSVERGIWVEPKERTKIVNALHEHGAVRDREVRFRMKSGDVRFMLWSAEVIDFGGEKCLIAVAHDITDRRQAEEHRLELARQKGPANLVAQLGLTMAGTILLGFALGYYLDKWLGTGGLFIAIFILLGVGGGGYSAYRQIMEATAKGGQKVKGGR